MSSLLLSERTKTKSATHALHPVDENGLIRIKERSASTAASVGGSLHTPSPLSSTPVPDLKSDSDQTMTDTPSTPAKKSSSAATQFIAHLPRADEEAFRAFTEIADNHYQYGTLGRSREALESMTCDCQYEPGQSHLFVLLCKKETSRSHPSFFLFQVYLVSCRCR
jgi:hypothetical protein